MGRLTVHIPFRVEPADLELLQEVVRDRGTTRSKLLREFIKSLAVNSQSENRLATLSRQS